MNVIESTPGLFTLNHGQLSVHIGRNCAALCSHHEQIKGQRSERLQLSSLVRYKWASFLYMWNDHCICKQFLISFFFLSFFFFFFFLKICYLLFILPCSHVLLLQLSVCLLFQHFMLPFVSCILCCIHSVLQLLFEIILLCLQWFLHLLTSDGPFYTLWVLLSLMLASYLIPLAHCQQLSKPISHC